MALLVVVWPAIAIVVQISLFPRMLLTPLNVNIHIDDPRHLDTT